MDKIRVRYDARVDAAYISFKKRRTEVTTMHLTEDTAVDFEPGEEIVGIEILDASKHFDLNREHPQIKLENLIPT